MLFAPVLALLTSALDPGCPALGKNGSGENALSVPLSPRWRREGWEVAARASSTAARTFGESVGQLAFALGAPVLDGPNCLSVLAART